MDSVIKFVCSREILEDGFILLGIIITVVVIIIVITINLVKKEIRSVDYEKN